MRTIAVRRVLAGAALVVGLPLAAGGVAFAQSEPSGPSSPSDPSGPSGPTTPTTTGTSVTVNNTSTTRSGTGSGTLSRTGGEWALPLAASGGAIAVVLGGRRLAARAVRG